MDEDLSSFLSSVSAEDPLAVEESFEGGYVRLRVSEAERRQAKHDIRCVEDIVIEMLRNSRDAHARTIFLASSASDSHRSLVFLDDGDGIPADMHERVFEPRVTSKLETMVTDRWGVHGRGMALYSIKTNASSASVVSSSPEMGSSIAVEVDTSELAERADQSSMPVLERADDGRLSVARGPHNIVRTVVEFALESRGDLDVFLGSPADIVAAMLSSGRRTIDGDRLLFTDDPSELPVCLRPAAAADACELVDVCAGIGLEISERTAHRILSGEIEPPVTPLSQLTRRIPRGTAAKKKSAALGDARGLKIADEDLSRFSSALEGAFSTIADSYYLTLSGKPRVRVSRDAISVTFPIGKER